MSLSATSTRLLNTSGDGDFPGEPVPVPDNPFGDKIFPNTQSKRPLNKAHRKCVLHVKLTSDRYLPAEEIHEWVWSGNQKKHAKKQRSSKNVCDCFMSKAVSCGERSLLSTLTRVQQHVTERGKTMRSLKKSDARRRTKKRVEIKSMQHLTKALWNWARIPWYKI